MIPSSTKIIKFGSGVLIFVVASFMAACGSNSSGTPEPPPSNPTLQTVLVSPQNPAIADGGATQAFTATAHYSDGSTSDVTSSVTWSSSNTAVATVNSSGLATSQALAGGVSAGFTAIQAVTSGIKGSSILSVTSHTGNGFAGVFTQHNDVSRTGQNLNETALTTAAVSAAGGFGKKFSQPVDGFIYAQPLYVPNVTIGGAKHNVVYVATENASVYAFDADTSQAALWHADLLDAAHGGGTGDSPTNTSTQNPCTNLIPQIGVTSTPVIDPSTGTIYVESKSTQSGNFFHNLHALDITTGNEKFGGPAAISGTVSGAQFNPLMQTNRPGLLLLNGVIYIAYASDCDNTPYHGWIFAYDAATLTQLGIFNSSPNGGLGGFWMAGTGISADSSGNIFIASGNGDFSTSGNPPTDLGDTLMKLFFTGSSFSLVDYFTPYDQSSLNANDRDLGSGGALLLPDQTGPFPHEVIQVGKEGTIYAVNRDQMTANNEHYCSNACNSDSQIAQELPSEIGGLFSGPAYWNNTVYFWGANDTLVGFPLNNGQLNQTQLMSGNLTLSFPGANPSISANGTTNGILWAIDATNYGEPKSASPGPAVLHAYDATNLSTQLYSSATLAGDQAGSAVKFSVPTIANGKVYIGTQTELDVYGLLP